MNDVVLNVERALGVIGERDEVGQSLLARREQADTRQILVALLTCNEAAERSCFRMGQRLAAGLVDVPRQANAAGQQQYQSRRRGQCAAQFTHRGIISGTLCTHADRTSYSQLRPARRAHDTGAGSRIDGIMAVLWARLGRSDLGFGQYFRTPCTAMSGDRFRGRRSDWKPGGE